MANFRALDAVCAHQPLKLIVNAATDSASLEFERFPHFVFYCFRHLSYNITIGLGDWGSLGQWVGFAQHLLML